MVRCPGHCQHLRHILIDVDAAGHGWFVDSSPADSVEFSLHIDPNTVAAAAGSVAYGKMDLVTREEFDVQAQVLARTREKLTALETRLTEIEKRAGGA